MLCNKQWHDLIGIGQLTFYFSHICSLAGSQLIWNGIAWAGSAQYVCHPSAWTKGLDFPNSLMAMADAQRGKLKCTFFLVFCYIHLLTLHCVKQVTWFSSPEVKYTPAWWRLGRERILFNNNSQWHNSLPYYLIWLSGELNETNVENRA